MHPIIATVGPSGAGKTTLMLAVKKRLGERIAILRALTTREPRSNDPFDDLWYSFISREEMVAKQRRDELLYLADYAGHLYTPDTEQWKKTLQHTPGLLAAVEEGVQQIQASSRFAIKVVRVVPKGKIDQRNEARRLADEERARLPIRPDLIIENSFEPGGLDRAIEEFVRFVEPLCPNISA